MTNRRVLIKLGGASLGDEGVLEKVTMFIKQFRELGMQVILVHGGGPAINAELTRRGITWNFLNGQRITTPEMMEVIEMVLSGFINPKLVKHLNSHDVPAIGFSGVDGPTLICEKISQELGMVGKVVDTQARWIEDLLTRSEQTPVIAPLGTGLEGQSYNVNADWAATHLGVALRVQQMIFLTDQKGILDSNGSVFKDISQSQLEGLVETETVTGGMLTKTLAVLHALENGIQCVRVLHAKDGGEALYNDRIGTWCLTERMYSITHGPKIAKKAPSYARL